MLRHHSQVCNPPVLVTTICGVGQDPAYDCHLSSLRSALSRPEALQPIQPSGMKAGETGPRLRRAVSPLGRRKSEKDTTVERRRRGTQQAHAHPLVCSGEALMFTLNYKYRMGKPMLLSGNEVIVHRQYIASE